MSNTPRRFAAGMALLLIGLSLILAVNLIAPRTVRANPGVLHAAPAAQGSGDCSSWANACTLQTALARAVSGDEIWVRAGVHYPGAAGDRTATFTLKNGVALYGGFAGTETSRDQRNWQANVTILSGDIDQNDNHGGDYINETASQIVGDNAYHVVTGSGRNATAVLDGFVVTAGQAHGASHWSGGGMYNNSGSPTLMNVVFSGNSAGSYGGGMYNYYNSSPALTNVTLSGNSASSGGGMYNESNSNPTLSNVTFSGNSAGSSASYYGGGGMYNDRSSPTLTNVTFSGNSAYRGGGMYNVYSNSKPTLNDVTFISNSARQGGGIYNSLSSPGLTNVTFNGNSVGNFYDSYGGGMYNRYGSPTLTNVIFTNNSAYRGGGMYNEESSPTLNEVAFNGNSATGDGGGMYNNISSPTLTNVTFSGNSAAYSGGGMCSINSYSGTSYPKLTNVTFTNNSANTGGGMSGSGATLTNVTFNGNSAVDSGGGMSNSGDYRSNLTLNDVTFSANSAQFGGGMYNSSYFQSLILSNVTFNGNSATKYGGGICNSGSWPQLTNAIFNNNSATEGGGGMYNSSSSPTLTNVVFSGNSASSGGGIYNDWSSSPTLINITFSGNAATERGGGLYNGWSSNPKLTNAILWGDSAPAGAEIYNETSAIPAISYSDIQDCGGSSNWNSACGTNGGNNIDADPLFVDAAAGNLRLQPISPAIDAGNNAAVPAGVTTDLDGNPRIDYIVDMGAYEYPAGPGPRPFGKTAPLNGNTFQPLTLTLSWNASVLANTYAYCYDTTDNNACDSTWVTTTQTSAQISGLSQGSTYYWQVRAVNNEGEEEANGGVWWSFTTAPSRPGFFNKTSPPHGTARAPVITTLSWSASPGVEQYEYCYDTTNDNACSTWLSAGAGISVTLLDLLQDTTYYWQVRATNAYGVTYANGSSTDFWSFTTFHYPGTFNKTGPADGASLPPNRNVTLSWSVSSDVDAYEYCYDTTDDHACATWRTAGTNTSVTLSGLNPNTTYYWQVRARNAGGITYANGSDTHYWHFATDLLPGAFNKSNPADGSSLPPNRNVILSWSASSDVDAYEYCYDTTDDNACTSWVSAGTNTSVTLSSLNPNTTYYWQVRARNAGGVTYADGSGTNYWRFATDLLPGAFNKTSPEDGSDQRNTVTLRWSASSDTDAYEYCYDTTNDNACSEWVSAGTDTSVTLSDLIPGATYYWQARARNAAGVTYADGSGTAFWSFRVNLVRWSGASASFLTDLSRTQWNTFRLIFQYYSSCTGAVRTAVVQIDGPGPIANNQFGYSSSSFSFSGQFTSIITATGTYNMNNYGVPVTLPGGICTDYVTQSGTWSATRVLLRPWVFGKAEPTNGATNQNTTLVLSWNPSTDATEYQYCLDTSDNNACDTSWTSAGANLSADLTDLTQNTTYYWQVRASNTIGVTDADSGMWWSFTTRDTVPPTVLSITRADPSPTNAATVRFVVAFSEAVQNVDAGDFSLTTTGLTGASVTDVTGSGAIYTVTVSTGAGSGALRLDIPMTATISALTGNPLNGLPYTGGEVYEISEARRIFLPLVLQN